MSERFALIEEFEKLAAFYKARAFGGEDWCKNYNIAPAQLVPVLVEEPDGRELRLMKWGLVPFWAKDAKIAAKMANAPAETLKEKPGFRDSFKDKRCVIPASGFYAWQKLTTVKQPYYFKPGEGLFSFAGLWSRWVSPDSIELESCAIVTVKANKLVKPVQDRMPALLMPESWPAWLAQATRPTELQTLLAPSPERDMKMIEISKYVNTLKNRDARCIEPLPGVLNS